MRTMISAQHGDPGVIDDYSLFPKAPLKLEVTADSEGYLCVDDCAGIGECVKILGGGRVTKEQEIDLSVGLEMKKKHGDKVSKGDILLEIHARTEKEAEEAKRKFLASVDITDDEPAGNTLIYTLDD